MKRLAKGFTIVELLIVIVVIAILAAITIVAYNGVQARARDSKRASDISYIEKAIRAYNTLNDGVPLTYGASAYTTGGTVYTGWDASTSSTWLGFLKSMSGSIPVDPINRFAAGSPDPPAAGNLVYFYYCYSAATGPSAALNVPYAYIGYHKDDGTRVVKSIEVSACRTS